jgi:two-component system, LuxR family, response regulator FixJ
LLALTAPNTASVYLLDDDPLVLTGMSRLLASAGLRAKQFTDPEEFFGEVKIHRTPVVIVDVWMPAMNGLEVQSRLREISPSTRVIIFTGKEDPLVRSAALNAGASAFVMKPFRDEEFLTAVRLALSAI